jgi:hypothetical protein
MKPMLFTVAIGLMLFGCSAPSEDEQDAIEKACQGLTVDQVKKIDDIPEDCKAAIAVLLPSPSHNLSARLFNLGFDSSTDRHKLILSGTDVQGAALTAESLQSLGLSLVVGGIEQKIPASGYTITKVMDNPTDLLSMALVGDYSGSMGDSDIALVSELFTDFTQYLTPISNFEVIYFSDDVTVQQTLTTDASLLQAALQKNTNIPRMTTALYDAMSKGAEDLAASTRLGHVLIVGTDGMENASLSHTKDTLKAALAADKKLLVVIMGTFLSDIDEMRDLAGESGIFVYAEDVKKGKEAILAFSKAVRESVMIELSELYKGATELKASLGTASVTFKAR